MDTEWIPGPCGREVQAAKPLNSANKKMSPEGSEKRSDAQSRSFRALGLFLVSVRVRLPGARPGDLGAAQQSSQLLHRKPDQAVVLCPDADRDPAVGEFETCRARMNPSTRVV